MDQPSAKLVDQKIAQLGKMARSVPVMFVGIACFLLHVLLSRIVSAQREQIATLKALGYGTRDLTIHYLEFALSVCLLGGLFGWILGALAAQGILGVYARYFRFPTFLFRFDATSVVTATAASVAAGIAGTYFAVRRAVAVPPAEAMRPEAPPSYRPTLLDAIYAWLPPVARMVLRDAARKPVRLVLSAASIGLATGIVLSGNVMTDSIDAVLRLEFEVAHREDVTVTLDDARPWRAVVDAAHLPGVQRAEGERQVPVRLRAANRERATAILGVDPAETLHTLLAGDQRPLAVPAAGLAISRPLAQELAVAIGDPIQIEVLEGDRRTLRLPVAAIVDDLMGLSGYMNAAALSRFMDETRRANVLLLAVDPEDIDDVTRRIEALPAVAAISRPGVDRGLVRAEVGDVFVALEVILALFAAAIAVGVVYNNARIALELRSRDLATMRILGFTRQELAFVLLGEQAIQLVLGIPLGLYLGRAMGGSSLASIDRELLRVPVAVNQASYVEAVCVVLLAAVACAWVVRRHADRLDLVAVLKARD